VSCSSGMGKARGTEIGNESSDENGKEGGDKVTICLSDRVLASSEAAGFRNISDCITMATAVEDEQILVNSKTESEFSVAEATCMAELVTNTPCEREVI